MFSVMSVCPLGGGPHVTIIHGALALTLQGSSALPPNDIAPPASGI